ncbi:uncharacterized protein BJ171DRAFT_64220 [Polychytrium aggregatum]|uniref:uncharacterized protein n=1 Tax=Polychytrium aggregatum TaxID=110093 RepID=UPI0022FEE61F|nr:uncharacterized protein BJ171DRAFT_64220 [Polychytrium aggregatum]KAI9205653.1 hypothetical protein BJ171DRAFT_64220 [Polychytrium aggregatum]
MWLLVVLVLCSWSCSALAQSVLTLTASNSGSGWQIGSLQTLVLQVADFDPSHNMSTTFNLQNPQSGQVIILCDSIPLAVPASCTTAPCSSSCACSASLSSSGLAPGNWTAIAASKECNPQLASCSYSNSLVSIVLTTAGPVPVPAPPATAPIPATTVHGPGPTQEPAQSPSSLPSPLAPASGSSFDGTKIGLIVGACLLASGGGAALLLRKTHLGWQGRAHQRMSKDSTRDLNQPDRSADPYSAGTRRLIDGRAESFSSHISPSLHEATLHDMPELPPHLRPPQQPPFPQAKDSFIPPPRPMDIELVSFPTPPTRSVPPQTQLDPPVDAELQALPPHHQRLSGLPGLAHPPSAVHSGSKRVRSALQRASTAPRSSAVVEMVRVSSTLTPVELLDKVESKVEAVEATAALSPITPIYRRSTAPVSHQSLDKVMSELLVESNAPGDEPTVRPGNNAYVNRPMNVAQPEDAVFTAKPYASKPRKPKPALPRIITDPRLMEMGRIAHFREATLREFTDGRI